MSVTEAQNVITAAVSNMLADPRFSKQANLSELPADKTASEMVRWHDDNGPGFVRYYLDTRADFVALSPLRLQQYENGVWCWSESKTALEVVRNVQGPQGQTLTDIQWEMARELSGVGQVALAPKDGVNGIEWHVLASDKGSVHSINQPGMRDDPLAGWLAWPSQPGLKPPPPASIPALLNNPAPDDWLVFERSKVSKVFRGQTRFFRTPREPLSHVIRDIRRYENAGRALHRATASQLVNSGLMWFKGNRNDAVELAQGLISGSPQAMGFLAQQILVFMKAADRSINDYLDSDLLAVSPYPFISEDRPEPVDVGRLVDPAVIAAKRDVLEDVARGLNVPQSFITEGPGAAQRLLNEWRQEAAAKEGVIQESQVIGSALTRVVLVPMLTAYAKAQPEGLGGVSPNLFRLWPDKAGLFDSDPPEPGDVLGAYDRGLITGHGVREVLHLEQFSPDLPDGLTDFELWSSTVGPGAGKRRAAMAEWFQPL